ncbi:MAG: hypothetical protein RLY31_3008 [Bacteroidota bacterium]|jgi:hypothetical protein
MGQEFNIILLRYYITDIVLEGPNGERFADPLEVNAAGRKGIYLVDEADIRAGTILLENVPAGEYNRISCTVGVDETGVREGAAGGVPDPATCNKFWIWNAGYIAVKFERQSPVSNGGISGSETLDNTNPHGILYHVGGWREVEGTSFDNNNQSLSYAFDANRQVRKGEEPHVHMVLDVLGLFKGVNMIDFTGNHNVHKPTDGKPLAENLAAAFAFDHIHP